MSFLVPNTIAAWFSHITITLLAIILLAEIAIKILKLPEVPVLIAALLGAAAYLVGLWYLSPSIQSEGSISLFWGIMVAIVGGALVAYLQARMLNVGAPFSIPFSINFMAGATAPVIALVFVAFFSVVNLRSWGWFGVVLFFIGICLIADNIEDTGNKSSPKIETSSELYRASLE